MKQSARQRRFRIRLLDKQLQKLHSCQRVLQTPPCKGWVRTIRETLGMSAAQLAKRLGVTRMAIHKLEEREVDRRVTLKQLDKTAASLGCEVWYALVPKNSLELTIRERARSRARKQLNSINQSMALEAESVEGSDFEDAVASASSYTEALTNRQLWDDYYV